jgi:hypothetical protein
MKQKRVVPLGFFALIKDSEIKRYVLPEVGNQPHCKTFLKGDQVYRSLKSPILDFS